MAKNKRTEFLLYWVILNVIAIVVISFVFVFDGFMMSLSGDTFREILLRMVFWGGLWGLVQMLVLESFLKKINPLWILATAFALPLGLWIGDFVLENTDGFFRNIASFPMLFFVGLVLGLFQWLILRLRFPKAGWWIASSAISLTFGFVLLYPIITYATLVWLSEQSLEQEGRD